MANKVWGSRIDPKIAELVKKFCKKNHRIIQYFIEEALTEKMDKEGRYGKANAK